MTKTRLMYRTRLSQQISTSTREKPMKPMVLLRKGQRRTAGGLLISTHPGQLGRMMPVLLATNNGCRYVYNSFKFPFILIVLLKTLTENIMG